MRILTWNSQGLKHDAFQLRLDNRMPNIMVIQEAGNLGNYHPITNNLNFNQGYYLGQYRQTRYHVYWVPWVRTTPGGNLRCSMAIFSDSKLEMLRCEMIIDDPNCQPRPLLSGVYRSHWAIANIHAGGKDYIESVFKRICVNHGTRKKIIIGDFNQSPSQIRNIPHPPTLKYLQAPTSATRPSSNRIIDLAISSEEAENITMPMPYYGGSDHRTVEVNYSA